MNDFLKRVLVALAGIPVMLGAAIAGGIWFFIPAMIIAVGILYELYRLAEKKNTRPQMITGMPVMIVLLIFFGHGSLGDLAGIEIAPVVALGFVVGTGLAFLIFTLIRELIKVEGSPLLNLGVTYFGIFYVGLGIGTFIGIREFTESGAVIILILLSIWMCDTAAYLGGKAFGRHKLYPAVSPNKTIEGAVFGFVFAVLTSVLCKYIFAGELTLTDAVVIGLIVGVVGQAGDLVESMIKRDAGVKDSSSFFPGHGGFLDRFDSVMFVSPAVYLYIVLNAGF